MDYCTYFPEGWWAKCCGAHDVAYGLQVAKEVADAALASCVAGSGSGPVMAAVSVAVGGVMWLGVRLFGRRYYNTAGKAPSDGVK